MQDLGAQGLGLPSQDPGLTFSASLNFHIKALQHPRKSALGLAIYSSKPVLANFAGLGWEALTNQTRSCLSYKDIYVFFVLSGVCYNINSYLTVMEGNQSTR